MVLDLESGNYTLELKWKGEKLHPNPKIQGVVMQLLNIIDVEKNLLRKRLRKNNNKWTCQEYQGATMNKYMRYTKSIMCL